MIPDKYLIIPANYYVDQWMPPPYQAPYHWTMSVVRREHEEKASSSGPRRQDGLYPPRAYYHQRDVYILRSPCRWAGLGNTDKVYFYSTSDPSTGMNPCSDIIPIPQELIDAAVVKFYKKVSGGSANLLDFYRTRQEAIDMISHAVGKLNRLVRKIHPGRTNWWALAREFGLNRASARKAYGRLRRAGHISGDGLKDTAAAFGAAWLQLRYGWEPTVHDIFDVADSLKGGLRIGAKITASVTKNFDNDVVAENAWTYSRESTRYGSHRVKLAGFLELQSPWLASAHEFGLDNPTAVAWEATRASFLVDWVWNVGDYLGSSSIPSGYSLEDFSMTFKTSYIEDQLVYDKPFGAFILLNPGSVRVTRELKHRTLSLPSYPLPTLDLPKISLNHFWDSLALLANGFLTFGRKS